MPDRRSFPQDSDPIEAAASAWLARRDRGLTATEQDEFLQWLHEDPRRRKVLEKLENTWEALDRLAEWRPAHSAQPNADLLAGRRPFRRRPFFARVTTMTMALAAAAALVAGVFLARSTTERNRLQQTTARAGGVRVIPPPERLVLADGSAVELNHDGRIETAFSAAERRVRLERGEAYFSVTEDSVRPFVVEAGGVAVRAVGTAFNVRRVADAVEVLVTEGRVEIEKPPEGNAVAGPASPPTPLSAGQRVLVETSAPLTHPVVVAVSAREIERALAWQGVRLAFEELPLSEVVAEFNRRNPQKLVIGDETVGGLRVGGTFRADNVSAFARLLELSFGVAVEHRADGALVLTRAP